MPSASKHARAAQATLLMCFNDVPEGGWLRLAELAERTSIADRDLRRALAPLVFGRHRILCVKPHTRDMTDEHAFSVNGEFRSKYVKLKVQSVATARDETDRQDARQRVRRRPQLAQLAVALTPRCAGVGAQVEEDRKHQIDAVIVRVMKARRQAGHTALVAEVSRLLMARFVPEPLLIKMRIESLIERDYLRRDCNDHRIYHYMA